MDPTKVPEESVGVIVPICREKGADRIRTGVLGLSGSYLYEHRTAAVAPEGATDG